MRVLVTGGAGFIGSAISRELLILGHEVRVIDNLFSGFASNVPAEAEFINADIRDEVALEQALKGVQVVFHQAAFKSVPKSIDDPCAAESSNCLGTLQVLIASQRSGVERVIYASSSSAYGEAEGVKHEMMPTLPVSPYGVSKLGGEHYCRIWSNAENLSTVCLRYFNVFGPGQRPDAQYSAVFPAFVSALQRFEQPRIFGDGEQTRDFTYIDDVVRANLLAMSADSRVDGQVLNICAGSPRTVNEVFETIAASMDTSLKPEYVDPRPGDIRHSHGVRDKAIAVLGWEPEAVWDEAVRATVDWFVDANVPASRKQK